MRTTQDSMSKREKESMKDERREEEKTKKKKKREGKKGEGRGEGMRRFVPFSLALQPFILSLGSPPMFAAACARSLVITGVQ